VPAEKAGTRHHPKEIRMKAYARFANLSGAVVVMTVEQPADQTQYGWRCEGCQEFNLPNYSVASVRKKANDHSSTCRALPMGA
jgi:hypothetical protein